MVLRSLRRLRLRPATKSRVTNNVILVCFLLYAGYCIYTFVDQNIIPQNGGNAQVTAAIIDVGLTKSVATKIAFISNEAKRSIVKNGSTSSADRDKRIMELVKTVTCPDRKVVLSSVPLPITGLSSFPGSGNTWVRHLIQQMTGIGTSSMYCDPSLRSRGFPFECSRDRSKVAVVKTHEEDHYRTAKFERVVLLIRNPYDALLAYTSMAKSGHTGHANKKIILEASNRMFNWSLWWYKDLTNGTLTRYKGQVYVLQYERVKNNMAHELRKLAEFLGINVTDQDIACTIKKQEGNFHRQTSEADRLELLKSIYDKEKLLRLRDNAEITRNLIKDKFNLDFDIGGEIEKVLLKGVTR